MLYIIINTRHRWRLRGACVSAVVRVGCAAYSSNGNEAFTAGSGSESFYVRSSRVTWFTDDDKLPIIASSRSFPRYNIRYVHILYSFPRIIITAQSERVHFANEHLTQLTRCKSMNAHRDSQLVRRIPIYITLHTYPSKAVWFTVFHKLLTILRSSRHVGHCSRGLKPTIWPKILFLNTRKRFIIIRFSLREHIFWGWIKSTSRLHIEWRNLSNYNNTNAHAVNES